METTTETQDRARKIMANEGSPCKCGVCFMNLFLRLRNELRTANAEPKAEPNPPEAK